MRKAIILLVLCGASVTASAQVVFPADSTYVPLRCGDAVMTDPFADESGALNERDIVGDLTNAAGLRSSDDTNLYLRMRLEEDAAPGGTLSPFSWGMELDLDNDLQDYELLILVDGVAGNVQLFRNTTTTLANSPNDPADQPAVNTYTFAMNGRTIAAPGTNYGGSADFYLDFAVPWSALNAAGLARDTTTHVWVATSSSANSLNGDFACHTPADGAADLTGTASDETTGDPDQDPGGTGGTGRLEGGGGCAAGGNGGGNGALVVVLALVPFVARRRRSASMQISPRA